MTAQGLLWNTLFLSSLVRYHLFLSSKTSILQAISQHFFYFYPFSTVFKINAIDGKKWVKFVATQQNNATLIYDLKTMYGTVQNDLKNIAQPFKAVQFRA